MSKTSRVTVIGNRSLSRFDFLIIGSGAGGSSLASILCAHGKKVLILECGSSYYKNLEDPDPKRVVSLFSNDELKMVQRRLAFPDPLVDPWTFRDGRTRKPRTFVGDANQLPKVVGGGSMLSDLKTPRFLPFDFEMKSRLKNRPVDANFADWPISYDELEPFYEYVETAIGVQGVKNASPFEAPRRNPFPMEPGVPMYGGLLTSRAAEGLGYHPFPYPTAINSRPYGERPACINCGFCGYYGCPISAKGSPAMTTLRKALLSGNCQLWPDTKVTRLRTNSAGNEITGVEALNADGEPVTFRADRYMLAANSVESARLLLLSDPGGPGLGNSSGMVGRNLMVHHQTIAVGIFKERLHPGRGRTNSHGMLDFRGSPEDNSRPMGGIVEFATAGEPIREAGYYSMISKYIRGVDIRSLLQQSPLRDRILVLVMQGEDAPLARNRVDLDPDIRDLDGLPVARLTLQNHPYELAARKHYSPKMVELLGKAGAAYAFAAPMDKVPLTRHNLGTLRFGDDPKQTVCDRNGRFHDIGNLHCVDGSLMPTGSGMNPTLTIAAVAAKIAGELIHPGSPERALPQPFISDTTTVTSSA